MKTHDKRLNRRLAATAAKLEKIAVRLAALAENHELRVHPSFRDENAAQEIRQLVGATKRVAREIVTTPQTEFDIIKSA